MDLLPEQPPKFALCAGPISADFVPAWPTAPDAVWQNELRSVTVWLWDVATPNAHRRLSSRVRTPLHFTVGNADYLASVASPQVTVRLDRHGAGEIAQDPLGLHPLYEAKHRETTFVSNCAHLTAALLAAATGEPVRKSLAMAAWLATDDRPIGRLTGYEGVLCTPYATRLQVHSTNGIAYCPAQPPWIAGEDEFAGATTDDLVDRCAAEMVENLRAHVANADGRPQLQLTGGYDSRLVLALAVEAAVLKDVDVVTFRTASNPNHPDVVIASQLTAEASIDHAVEPWPPMVRDGGGQAALAQRTAGMLSLRMPDRRPADGPLALYGLLGEAFRSNVRTQQPITSLDGLLACWLQPKVHSGFLRREPQIDALVDGMERLLAPLDDGVRVDAALDAFNVEHLMRRWLSVRPGFFWTTTFPLYCMTATRLAFRMGWAARMNAFLHETLIARRGGAFVEVPYAAGEEPRRVPTLAELRIDTDGAAGLEPRSVATSWYDNVLKTRRPSLRAADSQPSGPLGRVLALRQDRYREAVAGATGSAIWDILHPERVHEAVDLYPKLGVRARQDLDATMAGVIWHSD